MQLGRIEKRLLLDAYQNLYPSWEFPELISTSKILYTYWGNYSKAWDEKNPFERKVYVKHSGYVKLSRSLSQLERKGLIIRYSRLFKLSEKGEQLASEMMNARKCRLNY